MPEDAQREMSVGSPPLQPPALIFLLEHLTNCEANRLRGPLDKLELDELELKLA